MNTACINIDSEGKVDGTYRPDNIQVMQVTLLLYRHMSNITSLNTGVPNRFYPPPIHSTPGKLSSDYRGGGG